MPNDILYDAAHAFSKMLEYDYHFILGDSKRQKTFSIISNEKDMFTHICGIDHLKDIPKATAKKSSEKIAILKNILSKKITYSDISGSQHLYETMSNKQNPITGSAYTIFDRISHLSSAESILDGCEKGTIYRWNNGPSGQRLSRIQADYVLTVPSNNHPEEIHYFFLVVTEDFKRKNVKDNSAPIKTKIISAFSDRDKFLGNLSKPYTILEVSKIEVKTEKIVFTKTYPAYQKEKDNLNNIT